MAINTSIIKFKGKIGNLSFFFSEGVHRVRRAGIQSKEAIKTKASCKRVRENNEEFKGCAMSGKALRHGLNPIIRQFSDRRIQNPVLALMRKIADQGSGIRGQRSIDISLHKNFLEGFNFKKEVQLDHIFHKQMEIAANSTRNEATLHIPSFEPSLALNIVNGASHFQIYLVITAVSDHIYNANTKRYQPVIPGLSSERSFVVSNPNPIVSGAVPAIHLTTALPSGKPLPAQASLVVCIAIEFLQQVGSTLYPLQSGSTMRVERVI